MINENPLVTIIAACYNHERFVVECLEGIRTQTYPNIQLIITDDCSKDRSVEVIESWIKIYDIKCDFIKHTQNIGLTKTLNQALTIAEGKYIAVISTDDNWFPKFIETNIREFEKRTPNYGLIYGNSYRIDEDGTRLPSLRKRFDFHPEGNILFDLIKETFIATNTVIMRKSYLESIGNFDEDLVFEDFDIWTRLAEICKFAFCPEIHANYRYVKNSLSNSRKTEIAASMIKILERLEKSYPEAKADIEARKVNIAKELYQLGYPNSQRYLFHYYLKHKSLRNLYLTIMSSLKVDFRRAEQLLVKINRVRKR